MDEKSNWIDSLLLNAQTPDEAVAQITERIATLDNQLMVLRAVRSAILGMVEDPESNNENGTVTKKKPGNKGKADETKKRLRDEIAAAINKYGPLRTTKLKEIVKVGDAYLYEIMAGPWFKREADGWHLTDTAYSEIHDGPPTEIQPDRELPDD